MGHGLFCLILCLGWQYAASSPVSGTVSEYEYVREADAWLRLHIVPATWSDAALLCQLEGGLLASPTTSAMVQSMVNTIKSRHLAYDRVFIGGTDLYSKGDFKLVDGTNLAKSLEWAPGEPDNAATDENCLALTDEGTLIDVRCSKPLPYFCRNITNCPSTPVTEDPKKNYDRYDVDAVPSSTDNIEIPSRCAGNGYEWEARTGSCYKFFRTPETWREALRICYNDGGHLAIINSDTESTVLKEIFEKNPRDTIVGSLNPNYALIGFREWDDGMFATIQGTPLDEAGFERWSEGEPSNSLQWNNEREDCGSIYRDGLLNDAPCRIPHAYICEITP